MKADNKRPYDLLIFDWDGTLIDSTTKIVNCLRAAITDVGVESRSDEQLSFIIGLGLVEAFAYLYPNEGAPEHAALAEAYKDHFLYKDQTDSVLFAGVQEMLFGLKDQGYYLAVATGKARAGLDRILKQLNLMGLFHATRCADETTSKPDPHMLLELMKELDVSADKALMVGDTEFDIKMAQSANMLSIAVPHGAHSVEHLNTCEPALMLNHVTDLGSWLNSNAFSPETL